MIAIDLFAGAGGMSLGAKRAGIHIKQAVECDPNACATFRHNFPDADLFEGDICNFTPCELPAEGSLVFGGPPCQGFSTSNQRTRTRDNPKNWMFREFFRVVEMTQPEWVIFENVKGLIETEKGFFLSLIIEKLQQTGYTTSYAPLDACDFGVPQHRTRVFVVGNRKGRHFKFPQGIQQHITVSSAIDDLPVLENGATTSWRNYPKAPTSAYAADMRSNLSGCENNITTKSAEHIIRRFSHVPQGGNWENIPDALMQNYRDRQRCHTGIYHRLHSNRPSVVLGNFRKNMLIHPTQNRGLSVREAARLQSFPDCFEFQGSIGFQQQQVGNAVPPLLAQAIFSSL